MAAKSILNGPVDESRGNKYFAVAAELKEEILSGKLTARLPGTPALAARFGVTRVTLGKALAVLKEEGLIYSIAGKGTFVTRLKRPRTHVLGGIFGSAEGGPLTSQLIEGIQQASRRLGEAVSLHSHYGDSKSALRAVKALVEEQQVDGIILWPVAGTAESPAVRYLVKANIPFVAVVDAGAAFDSVCSCVTNDDAGAAAVVTEHLIERGHRRIGFVSDAVSSGHEWSERRYAQYRETMSKAGLDWSEPLSLDELEVMPTAELHAVLARFSAVFCITDRCAAGLLRQCLRVGTRVPEDLAVAGYDNTEVARCLQLTTVEQHFDEIGRRAVELLVSEIEARPPAYTHVFVESELVIRSSTGKG